MHTFRLVPSIVLEPRSCPKANVTLELPFGLSIEFIGLGTLLDLNRLTVALNFRPDIELDIAYIPTPLIKTLWSVRNL